MTMPASPTFARIERDVLRLTSTIPSGHVCTYADLGAAIVVPARYVQTAIRQTNA